MTIKSSNDESTIKKADFDTIIWTPKLYNIMAQRNTVIKSRTVNISSVI